MGVRFVITLVLFVGLIALGGCAGPQKIFYGIESPATETVQVSGIPPDCYPVELSDQCGSVRAQGDTLLLITEQEDRPRTCYALNLRTGEARRLMDLTDQEPSYFWDTHTVSGMASGEECGNVCASATPFGGTTEKFGFEGRKELTRGTPGGLAFITSYQFQQDERVTWTSYCLPGAPTQVETSTSVGRTIKFLRGEDVIEITDSNGYYWTANIRARAYVLNDRIVLAEVPDSVDKSTRLTNIFVFDLEQKTSHGAEYRLDKSDTVVDFGVAPDQSAAALLILREKGLYLIRMDPRQLATATKAFITRGE